MADETKKYLINIESNLKQYIEDLKIAKKNLEDTKLAVDNLKTGQFKSREEIELTNAAYREAQRTYNNAKKSVDLVTQANKAQSGSYEQLYRQWQLAQVQLKLTGDAMIKNADGTYTLSQRHMQAKAQVTNLKTALDNFGKSVHDNRLNVGSYSEAIEGALGKFQALPGPIGRAASSAQSFVTSLAKIGPTGLLVAGVIMAIATPLALFFTKSQKGMDLLSEKAAGVKAAFRILAGELIDSGDKMAEGLTKPAKEGLSWWEKLLIIMGGPKWTPTIIAMGAAATAAENYTKKIHEMEDAEIAMIKPRAEANLAIKEARLLYADISKSFKVRLDALQNALDLENETADKEVEHAKQVRDNLIIINNEKKKANQLTRDDNRKLAEAEAKIIDLQADSAGRQVRATKAVSNAKKELLSEEYKQILAEEKLIELSIKMEIDSFKAQKSALKSAYDEQTSVVGLSYEEREKLRVDFEAKDALLDQQAIAKQKEVLAEQLAIQLKEVDTIIQPERLANAQKLVIKKQYDEAYALLDYQANQEQAKRDQTERDRKKKVSDEDIKAGFEAQRLKVENKAVGEFSDTGVLNTLLDAEYANMLKSVEYEKATTNQKLKIDEEYNKAKKVLSLERMSQLEEERQVVADAFGVMSDILGKNTIVGKAMGIAQATINTWIAASKALATYPPPFSFIAMASAIASGLMTVANIVKVKVPGKSDTGSSAPSSISASPAVHQINTNVGSNILQPQLTQTQLNAFPQSGALNATDIAVAIGKEFEKLPTPVVTVEDINARVKQTSKVSVRANI